MIKQLSKQFNFVCHIPQKLKRNLELICIETDISNLENKKFYFCKNDEIL